jgi:hypothetical protein
LARLQALGEQHPHTLLIFHQAALTKALLAPHTKFIIMAQTGIIIEPCANRMTTDSRTRPGTPSRMGLLVAPPLACANHAASNGRSHFLPSSLREAPAKAKKHRSCKMTMLENGAM